MDHKQHDSSSEAAPPSVMSLKQKGNEAMKSGRYEEAMLHYTHAIKLDPNESILYSNRSFAFLKLKQFALSMEDALQTIALRPQWAKGYFRRGEVEFATDHFEEAQESYEEAQRLQPEDASIIEAVEKARRARVRELKSDAQIPWLGSGIGIIVGVLLLLGDSFTENPTHPIIMACVTVAISLLGYIVAKVVRSILKSHRRGMLDVDQLLESEEDVTVEKSAENGTTRNRYSKFQARQRFRRGKMN